MSEEEFLKRWSRRKQEARQESRTAEPPLPPVEKTPASPGALESAAAPELDISKLPSIDSITAASDISEFLRKGIPAELSRTALRRAWAADPAIRDFVGLAENAWDFTDPNAMPGFGALQATPEQIGAMVERVMGGARDAAGKLAAELPEKEEKEQLSKNPDREPVLSRASEVAMESPPVAAKHGNEPPEQDAAAQPQASNKEPDDATILRRTHGGALPS
jgi:hypothetical protein